VLTGRYSESYMGGPLQVGNTIHMQSHDPGTAASGTQWRFWCGSIASAPVLVWSDGTEAIYHASYAGGALWLSMDGPWGNGEDYTAYPLVDGYAATITYHYLPGGKLEGIETVFNASFQLVGYESCAYVFLEQVSYQGDTDGDDFPDDYPELLDGACAPGPAAGAWGTASDITFSLFDSVCTLSTEETSWGQVKAMYR
jgi:hypothetical protein